MEHEDVKNPFLFFLIKIWGKNAQNNTIAFYIGPMFQRVYVGGTIYQKDKAIEVVD